MTAAWQPIETAPKDGRIVHLCWMENGEPAETYVMKWCHIQKNALFPEKIGMWTAPNGAFTWNDAGDGGPTHWRGYP